MYPPVSVILCVSDALERYVYSLKGVLSVVNSPLADIGWTGHNGKLK